MDRLSRTELTPLEKALAIGILSPVKFDQMVEWNAKNRRLGFHEPTPQGYLRQAGGLHAPLRYRSLGMLHVFLRPVEAHSAWSDCSSLKKFGAL